MFSDWFDGRFLAAGARSYRLSLPRMAAAAGLWALIGLSVGWPVAGVWGAVALAVEWPLRAVTRPMWRGETLSAAEGWICVLAWFAMVSVWSAAGAILWCQASPACQLAGAAVLAAQLFYVEAHHGRSLGALVPALPALAAPVVAPLAAAHFRGTDQIVVAATLAALAAHGAVSLWVSYREGCRRMAAEAEGERLAADLAAASRAMSAFVAQAMRRDAPAAAAMAAATAAPALAERRKQAA
jgi:hypothetical protein